MLSNCQFSFSEEGVPVEQLFEDTVSQVKKTHYVYFRCQFVVIADSVKEKFYEIKYYHRYLIYFPNRMCNSRACPSRSLKTLQLFFACIPIFSRSIQALSLLCLSGQTFDSLQLISGICTSLTVVILWFGCRLKLILLLP